MSCIMCFLTDDFQDRIRKIARLKSDRFENSIDEYKKLFTAEFDALQDVENCDDHNDLLPDTIDWCNELLALLKGIADIPAWFDKIRSAYIEWIGGNFSAGLEILGEGITEKDIFQEKNGAEYIFCIRGRTSKSSLNIDDLSHIPFNKRFLVSNQRFSITGLPLLYLGMSPADILYELRVGQVEEKDLYFSSFVLQNPSSLLIADLTNQFSHYYSNYKAVHAAGSPICFNDPICRDLAGSCIREYYKFILSSVCSFGTLERFDGSNFVEEYVLPQMLSERVRQKGFDGITYSSTRMSNKECYSEEIFHTNKHRENLVLFTRFSETENLDQKLLSKFEISRPVRFSEISPVTMADIEQLKTQIIDLNNTKKAISNIDLLAEYSGIKFDIHFGKLQIKDHDGNFVNYTEHLTGKMHLFLLYQHMLAVRNWLRST